MAWCGAFLLSLLLAVPASHAAEEPDASPDSTTEEATPEIGPVQTITVDELLALFGKQRGKVVVINYWATWCMPCVKEMPEFATFHRKHREADDVVLLSISADGSDWIVEQVQPFVKKQKTPFPVYVIDSDPEEFKRMAEGLDLGDWDGALPLTLVYDRKGKKRREWLTAVTLEELETAVRPLRSPSPAAPAPKRADGPQ